MRGSFITYNIMINMPRLGAIILVKLHNHRLFNTPGGYVVDPINVGVCGVSNKYAFKSSKLEFSYFATFNVDLTFASKYMKVLEIWLVTSKEFIWSLFK